MAGIIPLLAAALSVKSPHQNSLLQLSSTRVVENPTADAPSLGDQLSGAVGGLSSWAPCAVRVELGSSCASCPYALVEGETVVAGLTLRNSMCTACNRNGANLTVHNLDTLIPPATCWRGVRRDAYCLGSELYALLTEYGAVVASANSSSSLADAALTLHPGSEMTAVLIVALVLVASLLVLFFGQALATPSLVLVALLTAGVITFALGHLTLTAAFDAYSGAFVPCRLPLLAAIAVALSFAGMVAFLAASRRWVTPAVLGLALGAIGMAALRAPLTGLLPRGWWRDAYWLVTALASVAVACLAIKAAKRDRNAFVLSVSAIAGGYGVASSVCALVRLYTGEQVPSVASFAVFVVFAFAGLVSQQCLTGSEADATRARAIRRFARAEGGKARPPRPAPLIGW